MLLYNTYYTARCQAHAMKIRRDVSMFLLFRISSSSWKSTRSSRWKRPSKSCAYFFFFFATFFFAAFFFAGIGDLTSFLYGSTAAQIKKKPHGAFGPDVVVMIISNLKTICSAVPFSGFKFPVQEIRCGCFGELRHADLRLSFHSVPRHL